MQVHFTTVQRLQAKYHRTRSVAHRPKQPRGRVTTRQQDQHIGNVHNRNIRAVASVTSLAESQNDLELDFKVSLLCRHCT